MQRTTIQNTQYAIRNTQYVRRSTGLALILAVVLTSLLAVIAVTFLLTSRMDSIATSAIAENKELNFAVDTVIAKISERLVADTPGITADEYYDYPDVCNAWLASLEPYQLALNDYRWRRITDLYGVLYGGIEFLRRRGYIDTYYGDAVDPNNLRTRLWADSVPVTGARRPPPFTDTVDFGGPADADGDGVADSRWIRLPNITSGKGKPIYAAIRIIDNSAMLNVNTAYKFDPNDADGLVYGLDGSSQLHVNLLGLSWRLGDPNFAPMADDTALKKRRANGDFGLNPDDLDAYSEDVIWVYGNPAGPYTPFDISDELEMRNRFVLNHEDIDTRLEGWGDEFRNSTEEVPYKSLAEWSDTVIASFDALGVLKDDYNYRHISTIHNMDRVIDPNSQKMLNVNTVDLMDPCDVYLRIRNSLLDGWPFVPALHAAIDSRAAQIAANLIDYRDADANVTVIDANTGTVVGFERPCVYISEVAQAFAKLDPNDPNSKILRAFAIELHKPYWEDNRPAVGQWQLSIRDTSGFVISDISIFWSGSNRFHVMRDDPSLLLTVDFSDVNAPNDINEPNGTPQPIDVDANLLIPGTILQLQRGVPDVNDWLTVDTVIIPDVNTGWPGPNDVNVGSYSYQRDITLHKNIRRIWDQDITFPTLGGPPIAIIAPLDPWPGYLLQAHPANAAFTNVGEIGMLFATSAYSISSGHTEGVIPLDPDLLPTRLNLADPRFQQIFKYLTVIDPADPFYSTHPAGETRIKGRININTAPWFVLAQLPWVSPGLAQTIVAYRDKLVGPSASYTTRLGQRGFENIAQLNNVVDPNNALNSIRRYAIDPNDLLTFPDLTPADDAINDFEERDVIFARISNLVTVRSDVFTAYILVRIGRDGPQKRVVAILDRSEVTPTNTKVKLIAVHPIADPR